MAGVLGTATGHYLSGAPYRPQPGRGVVRASARSGAPRGTGGKGVTAQEEPRITGSLVQSYLVCPRQAWLMSRQICPDEDHVYLELGRLVQQQTYARERKEVTMGHLKLDLLRRGNKELVVGEVKKSSRAVEAARMQLAFYLYELREMGVEAEGELLFPEERQKETMVLDDHWAARVEETKARLAEVLRRPVPPRAERTGFCRRCAYAEFCWA